MCCGCAGWKPSGTRDTPLISAVYLTVWETGAVGENMRKGVLVHICYVCVCLLCIRCTYGNRCLRVTPFISPLITIPTGKGGTEEPFKCKHSLPAHNTLRLRVSHSPYTVHLPRLRLPTPNTHTTCSSDCLPGRRDSGQLIFSSTHRLINTKTPNYSGLMQKNTRASLLAVLQSKPLFLQTVLFELVAHYVALSFTYSLSHSLIFLRSNKLF